MTEKNIGTMIEEKRKGRRSSNHTMFIDFANHPAIPGKDKEAFLGELIRSNTRSTETKQNTMNYKIS